MNFSKINDKEFERVCYENPDLLFETDNIGNLLVKPLNGGINSILNFRIAGEFGKWVENNKIGQAFSATTVFALPSGAKRSPDLAWIKNEKWETLTDEEKKKIPPLCPDFVVELRSPSDSLINLKNKMTEYIENGASLGWLIDPLEKKVHVYRQNGETEILENPVTVSGETLLENFTLQMEKIWS